MYNSLIYEYFRLTVYQVKAPHISFLLRRVESYLHLPRLNTINSKTKLREAVKEGKYSMFYISLFTM